MPDRILCKGQEVTFGYCIAKNILQSYSATLQSKSRGQHVEMPLLREKPEPPPPPHTSHLPHPPHPSHLPPPPASFQGELFYRTCDCLLSDLENNSLEEFFFEITALIDKMGSQLDVEEVFKAF
jgi:hypothetical protein